MTKRVLVYQCLDCGEKSTGTAVKTYFNHLEKVGWFIDSKRPGKQFLVMLGRGHRFLGITSTFWGVNVPCSRTQHGLTRVGLEPPTSGSGVRGINHQATALPYLEKGNIPYYCSLCEFVADSLPGLSTHLDMESDKCNLGKLEGSFTTLRGVVLRGE